MNKGIKLRIIVHNILFDILKLNINFEYALDKNISSISDKRDIAFINNVCLNSMRYSIHSKKILKLYSKKKPKLHEIILLTSAITQLVFLNFKSYAVISCSVEIAKKLNLYHGYVNALLKKILSNKSELNDIIINFKELPLWFREKTNNFNNLDKNLFLENYYKEPDIHIVFKEKKYLKKFNEKIFPTSDKSAFLHNRKNIELIDSFKDGNWWIQDFSSFYPLINIDEKIINNENLDVCAAPGGKSFQILSRGKKITLNDKSLSRIEILKKNLSRLNYKAHIINYDYKKLNKTQKYDFIILDAPCSSVGTIRKNPEIFYRKNEPDFKYLLKTQADMLDKTSRMLNDNGIILYMVCSFLKNETTDQVENFLLKNNNFILCDFFQNEKNNQIKKYIKEKVMLTLPNKFNKFNVDGYFAAYLKKYR